MHTPSPNKKIFFIYTLYLNIICFGIYCAKIIINMRLFKKKLKLFYNFQYFILTSE